MRFHHVGYAVKDIRRYLDGFLIPMFSPVSISEPVSDPIQRVTVCFAEMPGGTVIELVQPQDESGPVDSFIGSNRGGLYHLCYEVDNLDAELERFRRKGCLPLGKPVPAAAFEGRRLVFVLTPERDLIEFVEAPRA
jgi:methylmalonyl-CoA/ethylmalonyl-CoA epimerase